jgi:RimJ/RimL family protein N-acetyltransferase
VTPVRLRLMDEDGLVRLAEAARAGAEPAEVMPVKGSPGWTPDLVDAFRDFHRRRAADPARTTYAIVAGGAVVGSIRLDAVEGGFETGLWLARSARGQGIGGRALALVLAEARAREATTLIADTTATNPAAVGILRRNGASLRADGDTVYARFDLSPASGSS